MVNQKSGVNPLIKLGAVGVTLYLIYKILKPPTKPEDTPKHIYRCGNCTGVIVGRPSNCPWCRIQLDWSRFP